jgi:hypothetical protein
MDKPNERLQTVPRLPWEQLRPRLQAEFKQGSHATLLGPTEAGKTTLAIELAELRRYVLFLACKRRDPVLSALRARGYFVTGSLEQIPWTPEGPVHERIVYWPHFARSLTIAQRIALQKAAMRRALEYADRSGGWCIVVDEGIWMCEDLRLQKELNSLWFMGRTDKNGLVFLGQRPAWIPRYAYSQATLIAIWQTNDRDDLKRFSDMAAGIDVDLVRDVVAHELDWELHEFLLVNTRTRELVISSAPPPKKGR